MERRLYEGNCYWWWLLLIFEVQLYLKKSVVLESIVKTLIVTFIVTFLDNYLIPTVQLYQMENDFLHQHDNAEYHVSQQVQTKLHKLGVKLLELSVRSLDLNVIEHLWSIIDDKLKSKSISSVKQLTEALSTEWLSIKAELCNKLVFSMPKKIHKCIANNGISIDC